MLKFHLLYPEYVLAENIKLGKMNSTYEQILKHSLVFGFILLWNDKLTRKENAQWGVLVLLEKKTMKHLCRPQAQVLSVICHPMMRP